jgi:ubiquitin C-terminal hydrolase
MNAILQCLLHINELNNFFFNIYPKDKKKFKEINIDTETKGRLSEQYYKVIQGVNNTEPKRVSFYFYIFPYYEDNSFSPKEFNDTLSKLNPQFGKYESNDAKDLLLFLIQSMHSELNYYGKKRLKNLPRCNQLIEKEAFNFFLEVNNNLNLSIFSYLFYGINKSITICSKCKKVLYNFQFFHFLSLPTFNFKADTFNIYKGLKDFTKVEYMSGDNQFYCQNCKDLEDAKIRTVIYYTPPYLIINIDYGKNKQYEPLEIEFGEIIDLTGFVDISVKEKTYKLICVCSHIGRSGNSGHYITYCKDKNDIWHEFNDSTHIENINKDELNKNSPYILIYQRIKQANY